MDQKGLEGLDSFTFARIVWIEAKRRAVMPPMTSPPAPMPPPSAMPVPPSAPPMPPPPAPMSPLSAIPVAPSTPPGLQEADQARAFQAAWEACWKAGRSAGWQEGWDLRSAVDLVFWYVNSPVDL